MTKFEPYSRKIRSISASWLLLSSMFTLVLLTLIQPIGSNDWWNPNWLFRKQITINHIMVNVSIENFPILLDITDTDLKNKAQTDGDDIAFVGASNTTLNHEIEYYDSSTGRLVAWVKIPFLSSSEDTIIHMYYGNPEAQNQQNSTAVWDTNFIMIQHQEEPSGNRLDSTTNGNNATPYGTVNKNTAGKVGPADSFNGNGYLTVPEGFLPTSAITVEIWLKPNSYSTTTWTKYINTGPTTTRGICGGQTSQSADRWSLTLTWDGGTKSLSTGGQPSNYNWIHLAVIWNGTHASAYYNGVKVKEGAVSGTPDWTNRPLYLGSNYVGSELFNGSIDEVRISNVARSEAWIKTSYNNQQNPTQFYTISNEETSPNAYSLLVYETPPNEATDVYTNPTLSVKVVDPSQKNMTIIFREKISNTWVTIGIYENVSDETYSVNATQMTKLGTTYYWSVYVTNGETSTNKTFSLTTATKILQQKWVATNVPSGASGVLIADINNDGLEEILHAGIGGIIALNGTDGSIIWNVPDNYVGNMAQSQMADLNKDGILEIIVPLEGNSRVSGSTAGLLVLHANNGSVYWRKEGLGKETYSSPVICDIDGDGYPEIFFASTDVHKGLSGTGRITQLSYNGTIMHQVFAWRPCGGGLSIADTDGDGEFELYMGDRYMYLNSAEYGDNDYGKGVQSYWAKNLTLRWFRSDIFCSSQIPMIADVNKDGILDIIIGDMNGGVAVLNATDGSTIINYKGGLGITPTHYQPSVHDIDDDGNLEMLMADPHDDTRDPVSQYPSDDIVIWDLVAWKVDARIYIGKSFYGPQLADVTGDGKMEIVACNYRGIFIFDKEGRVLDGITGLAGTLNYAVAQDIDGDGYTELVISSQSRRIYAYDTPARRPNPRPRTEVQFYSEYRRGAAEHVPMLTAQNPIIFYTNLQDQAENVPLSLSQIQFTLVDYQNQLMNYTITTNPDIGSDSKTNVANGKYTLNITGLEPSTTYTWTLSITDGTNWTNKTLTFTTKPLQPWWDTEWQYRKKITIDHNKVADNLKNFPILIDIYDSDLATKAQQDGDDIAFTDSNNIKLVHEIELYDNNTGHLIAWVNMPNLSSTEDTIIYMYYGNSEAQNQQNVSGVWDPNFIMVQHLEELSGTRLDSTGYGNNATPYDKVTKASTGKIDGADNFNGLGYESVPSGFLPTSAVTVEIWLKPTSYSTNIWTKYINTGPKTTRGICGGQTSLSADRWSLTLTWDSGTKSLSTGGQPSEYNWIHLAVTWSGTTATAYFNGVKVRETQITGTPDWVNRALFLGSNFAGGEKFNGAIDEVRISNVARSDAWIKTSYNNQQDPTQFYTISNEETVFSFLMIYAPSPPDKASNISPSISELSFNITSPQGNMNYTVTTIPDIGSGTGINVPSGRYSINVSGLQYATTYKWTVTITNGTHQTSRTFTFTTYPSEPPTHDEPILVKSDSNIVCYNQSTADPDGDKVTNIYNWYRNGISITNLLLPFDTNSSTTVKDYSGYNNGVIVRDVTWTNNGIIGGAYNFNRGFIQIPGNNTLDGGGTWPEITVELWTKIAAYPQSGTSTRLIARIPSYEIGITGNKLFASIWTATGNPMISGHNMITYDTPLQLNTWYHITLTYKKGIGMTLYVNGKVAATKTPSESTTLNYNIQPSGTITPLYIGWFDYFKGTIDEVRIYPKSLTPQQIYQRYSETKDGLTDSSTIVNDELQTGDTWRCEVTPNDSHQDGTTKTSNTVTIGQNNKPSAKNLTITPTTPKTNETLTGNYTFFDPDGDQENGTEIRWYKNGELQPHRNDTLIVPANETSKGETWHFTVKPKDGTDFGELQTSPYITIQNSLPQITQIAITPDPAYTNTTLTANVTAFDADNDNLTFTYQWQKCNTTDQTWYNITGATNQTLDPENFQKGDMIKVICIPYDGQDYGTPQEANITISNAPPEILSWFPEIDPIINLGQSQQFNITLTDIDGDNLTIKWCVNGTKQAEWDGYTSITFTPNQAGTYIIQVIVSDEEIQAYHQWTLTVQTSEG